MYDRYRRPYPWNGDQQDYWERRRENAMSSKEFRRQMEAYRDQQNWSGFEQGPTSVQQVQQVQRVQRVRATDNGSKVQRSNRSQRVERSSSRSERKSSSERGSRKQSSSDFRRSMENQEQ